MSVWWLAKIIFAVIDVVLLLFLGTIMLTIQRAVKHSDLSVPSVWKFIIVAGLIPIVISIIIILLQ